MGQLNTDASASVKHRTVSVDGCQPPLDIDGKAMMALVEELFPICRSITGNGVRQTLEILGETSRFGLMRFRREPRS